MKKLFKNAALLTLCAVTFVGCASKVDFATFKSKAEEALNKTCEYTKAKVKGSFKSGDTTTSIDFEATVKDHLIYTTDIKYMAYCTAIDAASLATAAAADLTDSGYTYYAGSSFKATSSTETYEWNEYGLLTSYAKDSSNITISYSK